jgi:hypothetical protein
VVEALYIQDGFLDNIKHIQGVSQFSYAMDVHWTLYFIYTAAAPVGQAVLLKTSLEFLIPPEGQITS